MFGSIKLARRSEDLHICEAAFISWKLYRNSLGLTEKLKEMKTKSKQFMISTVD